MSWNQRFYSLNIPSRKYWSSEQICLELNVWMSGFLYIRNSRPEVSCKKVFLKFLQNSLKNLCDAVFNLKFCRKSSATILQNTDRQLFLIHLLLLEKVLKYLFAEKNFLKSWERPNKKKFLLFNVKDILTTEKNS